MRRCCLWVVISRLFSVASLFVACCLSVVLCRLLYNVCCVMFAGEWLLLVVCGLLWFAVGCFVVRMLQFVGKPRLFAAWCLLLVV